MKDIATVEKYLNKLLSSLRESHKRWCSDCVDDPEEMYGEYPDFIDGTISELEDLLEIPNTGLIIHSAVYGAGSLFVDVVDKLDRYITYRGLSFRISNQGMGGDPVPGVKKELRINYSLNGKRIEETINENEELSITINRVK
jgi:hypothetical protein